MEWPVQFTSYPSPCVELQANKLGMGDNKNSMSQYIMRVIVTKTDIMTIINYHFSYVTVTVLQALKLLI